MNRFDVCEAYWLYYAHWHLSGMTRRCHTQGRGIAVQLDRLRFRPSPLLSFDSLRHEDREDARDVYLALVRKWEGAAEADFSAFDLRRSES